MGFFLDLITFRRWNCAMNWFEVILLQICKVFFKYIVHFLNSDMQGKEKLLHETVLDIIIGALLFEFLCCVYLLVCGILKAKFVIVMLQEILLILIL